MKDINRTIVVSVIAVVLWVVLTTPPCDGRFEMAIGGDHFFLFTCVP